MIEMYEVVKGIFPELMIEVFYFREAVGYELKHQSIFRRSEVNSVYNATTVLFFLRPKIWEIIPIIGTSESQNKVKANKKNENQMAAFAGSLENIYKMSVFYTTLYQNESPGGVL